MSLEGQDPLPPSSELRYRPTAAHPSNDVPKTALPPSPTPAQTASWHDQLAQARATLARKVEEQQQKDGVVFDHPAGAVAGESGHAEQPEEDGPEHVRRASVASSEDDDEFVARLLRPGEPYLAAPATEPIPEQAAKEDEAKEVPVETPLCRICFDGPDEELGKLFSPCACKGTSRFVHQACLQQWRQASRNAQSFYACDLCKYRYQFRRTFLASVVTSKITVTLLTSYIFLLLVFLSGFFANNLISVVETRQSTLGNSMLSDLFVADHVLLGEGVREAALFVGHQLEESKWVASHLHKATKAEDDGLVAEEGGEDGEETSSYRYVNPTAGKRPRQLKAAAPPPDAPFLVRATMHLAKGSALMGLVSVFYTYVAASFVSPLGRTIFRAVRPGAAQRGRNNAAGSTSQAIIIFLIVIGIIRSIRQVYRGVRWLTKQALSRVEDLVLDVGSS
ncbi:hypothetical protein JCM11251_002233 [Rhodosporidiobolus azoricus]